jgi:hypothetical protein
VQGTETVLAELGAQETALNALEHQIAELKHGMPVEKAALAAAWPPWWRSSG